jgi:heat shock protein HtpX
MKMAKRLLLFFATNILVVVTISLVLNLLGIRGYLTAAGINYSALLGFCLVWGFGGAFISLALSRIMAKWMMGVEVVDENTPDPEIRWLVQTVHRLASDAGMFTMPEVGVYQSDELNAFATGPSQSRSLVAVSSGLLLRMTKDEIEGVLAHEVSHIVNGDMVTMTLIQGVVNAFVMFFARVIAFSISQAVHKDSRHVVNMIVTFVLEIALSVLGMIIVSYFSRQREFRADAGSSGLAGRQKMIAALTALGRNRDGFDSGDDRGEALATLKIAGRPKGILSLFATHPPLEERIQRLQDLR